MIDKQGFTPGPTRFGSLWLAPCLLPVLAYGLVGLSTGHDDSHITFWQAHTLLQQGALLNYNGERIEQSSSLLLVLLTAAAGALGAPLVTAGYLINLVGAILCIVLTGRLASNHGIARPWQPALLTALSPFFAYWAWSGMETTLAAACVLGVIAASMHWAKRASAGRTALLALAALALAAVRPEMVLLVPAFLLGMAALLRRPGLLLFILPVIALVLWRQHYFGQWFANPVYAKGNEPGLAQALRGLQYAGRLFREPAGIATCLAVMAGLALTLPALCNRRLGAAAYACLLWVVLYAAFVVASGGDWMKEGRFWVPLIAPLWLYLTLALGGRWQQPAFGVLALLLLLSAPGFVRHYNLGLPLWSLPRLQAITGPGASVFETANREHLREWPGLQVLQQTLPQLAREPGKPLTLMSKQMGMVNFHLLQAHGGELRVLDMAGLVDNRLRDCPVLAQDGFDVQGLRLNYRKFFERLPAARRECGIEAPDIIHDLYGWGETVPLPDFLATQGYAIVFRQTGQVALQPGRVISAQQMVAIRRERLVGWTGETRWVDLGAQLSGRD